MKLSQDPAQRLPVLKEDGSPVTPSDKIISDFLFDELSPHFPVICEERPPHQLPKNSQTYFLIDPLDGTRYYSQNEKEFAICVGLIKDGTPYYGAIYDPINQKLLWAVQGQGAFWGDTALTPLKAPVRGARVFSSGFHKRPEAQAFVQALQAQEIREMGSALKFCEMARGHVDLYIRFGPTSEWDTAAAQAILGEVGMGIIEVATFQPLLYGKKDFLNKGTVAGHKDLLPHVVQLIQDHQLRRAK